MRYIPVGSSNTTPLSLSIIRAKHTKHLEQVAVLSVLFTVVSSVCFLFEHYALTDKETILLEGQPPRWGEASWEMTRGARLCLSARFLLSEESSFTQASLPGSQAPFPVPGECLIRKQTHRITSSPDTQGELKTNAFVPQVPGLCYCN